MLARALAIFVICRRP